MKKHLRNMAALGLALTALTACNDNKFTVSGTIEGAADSVLYLDNVALTGLETIDSVRLGSDGAFSLSGKAPEAPDFYQLRVGSQIINLSIDSTETVTIRARMPGMASNYTVEGSDNCEKIRQLALRQQELLGQALRLEGDYSLSRAEAQDSLLRLTERYKRQVAEDYIFAEPQKAYAYFALFQRLGPWPIFNPQARGLDQKAFAAVATCWDTFYPGATRSQNLHNIAMENRKNQMIVDARNAQRLDDDKIVESGIIDISLADNHGRPQQLSSLKGRVVLLDFHSFALQDSPQRILMLRELYNKYHAQGLEIYQVSVDADEHFWKQQTRELPWICVRESDTSYAYSYNVQQVPEFFLIDRNNTLQKRSSQMKDVEQEIKALL